jgi:hypothetical protein
MFHGNRKGMSFLKEVCVNEKEKNINIHNHSKDTKGTLNWVVGKVYTLIQQKY